MEDTETTNGMGIMDEEFVVVSMDGVSYTENAEDKDSIWDSWCLIFFSKV